MQTATLVTSIGDRSQAKAQALSWLASQLRWERTLDELRAGGHSEIAEAA